MSQETYSNIPSYDEVPASSERVSSTEAYRRNLETLLCMIGQGSINPDSATQLIRQGPVRVMQSFSWESAIKDTPSSSDTVIQVPEIERMEAELGLTEPSNPKKIKFGRSFLDY